MDWLKAFLANHKITAHSAASLWVVATLLYANNAAFHDYVMNAYSALPHGLHSFLVGIVIPIAIFWRTTHSTKVSAEIEDGSPGVVRASASATTTDAPK